MLLKKGKMKTSKKIQPILIKIDNLVKNYDQIFIGTLNLD